MATRIVGVGAGSAGYMSPSTGNEGYTGDLHNEWFRREEIRNYEEETIFERFFMTQGVPAGTLTLRFVRSGKLGRTGSSGTTDWTNTTPNGFTADNTSATTPDPKQMQSGSITMSPDLLVSHYSFGRIAHSLTPYNHARMLVTNMMNSGYRERDLLYQEYIISLATGTRSANMRYPSGVTALSGFTNALVDNQKLTVDDVRKAYGQLKSNSAPKFSYTNSYVMVVSPEMAYDLMRTDDAANASIVELAKHTSMMAERLVKNVVGTIFGVTIIVSDNLKRESNGLTGNNQRDVHQGFAFAEGGFAAWPFQWETNVVDGPEKSDAANLSTHVAMSFLFKVRELQSKSWLLFRRSVTGFS